MFLVVLVTALFMGNNSEFFRTVEQQRAQGYTWSDIDCRQAEIQPAIVMNTPTDKEIVCYKLEK